MQILDQRVQDYLRGLRPRRSEVMAEMEAVAERDGVPIVHWETGRLLASLCRALDPVVLEVGTAIGYSTLHMAEQLEAGRVVTLELDPGRAAQARDFLDRAGVAQRVEIVEGDARETIPRVDDAFDVVFLDAEKGDYEELFRLAREKVEPGSIIVADNVLSHVDTLGAYSQARQSDPDLESVTVPLDRGLELSVVLR